MRRSQAPSQSSTPGAKRPKLDGGAVPSSSFRALQSSPLVPKPAQSSSLAGTRSSQDVLKLLENKSAKPEIIPPKPQVPKKEQLPTPEAADTKYFKVFWCKASTKKHKHWEEEAILIVKTSNRSVILKSLEEKVIGQATGFRLAQLQELEDGSILKVGGREVLIQEKIPKLSESCFTEKLNVKEQLCGEIKPVTPRPVANKPFTAPLLKSTSNNQLMPQKTNVIKPKHNPAGQNALVMPRPPSDVQWKECQNGVSIVDVVVDPLLTKNLRPHQRQGVTFLYECVMGFKTPNMYGAILADEMGLGKTLQTITLIWTLLHQGPFNGRPTIQKILIVAPSSLVKNWYKEFRRWLGTERINVFTADQQNRPIEFLKRPLCPVMVVSYEMLVRCFDEIQQVNFDLIVCDEGHRLKNAGNKTSSLLSQMDANRKILLTGTPVQNDLKEFFTLADFVNPGILGNLASFRRMYEEPIVALQQPDCDDDKREEGESSAAALSHLTSQFVLRRTQEVMSAHLPPKIESIIFCKPSPAQVRLYRTLLGSTTVGSFLSSGYSGNEHLGFIQALRKLCNHPSFFSDPSKLKEGDDEEEDYLMDDVFQVLNSSQNEDDDVIEKSAGKFQVTFDLLDSLMRDTKEKILLVSYSTKVLDLFAEACKERNYDSLRLDGSTPTNLRMGLVDRFNDATNPQRIFLLSSKAGGVGLNLIGASRLILYDIDWNPANDLQAMARIWRDGQKRTVQIYRLLTTGTIEEKIFQRQVLKQGLSGAVVDARDSTQGHFSKEELKDLFTLREDTDCDTHDLIKCQCLDGDLAIEKPPELDDYEFELDDERDCQLGGSSTTSKSKDAAKTVDQLMDWQHFSQPFSPGLFQTSPSVSVLESTRKDFEALLSSAYSSSEETSSKTTKKRPKRRVVVKKNEQPPVELAEMVSSPIKSPNKSTSGVSNSAFWYEKEDKISSSSSKSSTPSVNKKSSKGSSVSSVDHQVMIHGPRSSSSSSHPPLGSHSALTTPRYHQQSSEDESNSDPDEPEIQQTTEISVLKVIIHQTDRLIDQPSTKIQPMIIVHAVHPETGRYILHKDSPIPPQFTGSSNSNNTVWNQELTFQLDNLNNTLLLFELVSEQTLLAWGFLRPISRTGIQHVNKRIQLQLFRIPIRRLFHPSKPTVSDLFTWFKNHRKDKYPATLHVTILPVTSSTIHPEELTNPGSAVIRRNRLEGQPFKLPTRRSFSFGSSDAGSLMARYNPDGSSLAIALTNGDILIHSIGSPSIRLKGHQGNVYDLDWSPSSVLLSCGADSTARIWMNQSNSLVLAHPAFVYSARFINNEVIVTGCYDQLIRIWELLEDGSVKMKESYAQHTSPINCLAWDHLKRVLYSGDATGSVCLWNYADQQLEFERILNESSEEQRNKIAVNWLCLHPSGSRLLIQYKGSNLCMVEPKSGIKLLTYSGIFNPRLRLTSCITPCGNYVVAGSEDGSVHWFDLERCDLLAVCTLHGSYQPITAVAFHPTDHAVALCSLNPESAVTVLEFNKEDGAQVSSDAGFSLVTFPRTVQSAAFPIENVSRMTGGDSRLIGGNNKTTPTLDKLERIFRKLDLVMAWSHSIEQNDESIRRHQDE